MASTISLIWRHIADDARQWWRAIERVAATIGAKWLRDACMTTLFVVAPVVILYSSRSLPTIVGFGLAFAVAFALAAHVTRGEASLGRKILASLNPANHPWWVSCTLVLLVYAAASSSWALGPEMALEQSIKMISMFFAIVILHGLAPPLERQAQRVGAAVGIALAALVLIFELSTNIGFRTAIYGPNPAYMNRSVVTLSLLMWPTLALTTGPYRHWIRAALVVLVAVAVFISKSDSALLAIAAGLFVTSLALVSNRLAAIGVLVVAAVAFIAMPLTVQVMADLAAETGADAVVNLSTERRLEIWREFSQVALVHPVLGWGLESSRYFGMWDIPGVDWSIGPVHHPHNPILQIWVELGAIGVALAGLIMIGIVLSIPSLPGRRRSFAYGAITATLAISSVSHGAWQIWWICVLMLVVALFAVKEHYPDDTPPPAETAR